MFAFFHKVYCIAKHQVNIFAVNITDHVFRLAVVRFSGKAIIVFLSVTEQQYAWQYILPML